MRKNFNKIMSKFFIAMIFSFILATSINQDALSQSNPLQFSTTDYFDSYFFPPPYPYYGLGNLFNNSLFDYNYIPYNNCSFCTPYQEVCSSHITWDYTCPYTNYRDNIGSPLNYPFNFLSNYFNSCYPIPHFEYSCYRLPFSNYPFNIPNYNYSYYPHGDYNSWWNWDWNFYTFYMFPTPTSINVDFNNITFTEVGQTLQLEVTGKCSDGITSDITRAAGTTYISSDPNVVKIGNDGLAIAVYSGTATITVTNSGYSDSVKVSVYGPCSPSPFQPLPTLVTPDMATDGQRVDLIDPPPDENMWVLLIGYRYNNTPPMVCRPTGEGKERIYYGCQPLIKTFVYDPDGVPYPHYCFFVPTDAPSGEYSIKLLPSEGGCPKDEDVEEGKDIPLPSLFVLPSYIVTTLQNIQVHGNSEDDEDNPAELAFVFTSLSGIPYREGTGAASFVQFSGVFPGGDEGSAHITNADNTELWLDLPLYIGQEKLMAANEWLEECISYPAALETVCKTDYENKKGFFSDDFYFSISGVEYDSSPSKAWGVAAGVLTTAVGCYISYKAKIFKEGCPVSGSLGYVVGKAVNDALEDDDDNLGIVEGLYHQKIGGFGWEGDDIEQGPFRFGGPLRGEEKGNIDIWVQNERVCGPRILQYKVTLKSIKITDDYEEDDCSPPNEVFLHSRVFLGGSGSILSSTKRFPDYGSFWLLSQGETKDFGASPLILDERTYSVETAPESPLLYIELSVWEDDEGKDLMGIHSWTIFFEDFFEYSYSFYPSENDEYTPEGYFIRRVKRQYTAYVHGYAGSDNHCWGWWAHGWDPQAHEGAAELTYEVEATWLKMTMR
ncbi:MAG: Ig-like domain-containing protein [bacterium]